MKLQRNALSVIEAPSGHEEDDEIECENIQWNSSNMGKDPIGLVKICTWPSSSMNYLALSPYFDYCIITPPILNTSQENC